MGNACTGLPQSPGKGKGNSPAVEAIAGRGKPVADIEEGHISSSSCILANLALQLGRTLTWDARQGQVAGDEEANRLLRRAYRAPWKHLEA